MKSKGLVASFLVLTFSAGAYPDAFKCKSPDGTTVISSTPCQSGSRTEAIQRSEEISPEQRRRAEQEIERQQKLLAEREAARAAEQQREQESRRKLAEEESQRQTQCLQNAQREADPQLRASLIAACSGAPIPQPIVVQQPVYVPVAPPHNKRAPASIAVCISGDCKVPDTGAKNSAPKEPTTYLRNPCRQVGGTTRCD